MARQRCPGRLEAAFGMRVAPTLLWLALCAPHWAWGKGDELQRLREENAQLKAQLQACHPAAAAATGPVVAPVAPVAPAPAAATPAIPPGYELVKAPEPYSQTGCSHGLFSRSPDAPWRHGDTWDALNKGMTPAEVEKLLGPDHYNLKGDGRLAWQYGKCGHDAEGSAIFENGRLLYWQKPDL
jgi:hypothetical protein